MATVQQNARLTRFWFYESKHCNSSKTFRLLNRNCHSPSKNSINRWYEQFKGTGNQHHRKSVGRPSVTDEVVHRVKEAFTA
ncbi:hypothetical protein AVEN_35884-1 [Araneus ventricosus]|uniref:DUF4817 domain-containing protein n=1 Tax=Araneus ventricosus TaxID=182803 RepID=A0A4Y2CLN3_ARAVE|nr:hypothetical protein AVEN_35884-1 [Araneus ventricosus]